MAKAGAGHRFHVTGLTHDERGYPVMNADAQEKCVRRLVEKVRSNAEKITIVEESETSGADIIVVSYGITSRVAVKAIEMAKTQGIKVGHLRLVTVWPFAEKRIRELASRVRAFVMPGLITDRCSMSCSARSEGSQNLPDSHGGGTVQIPRLSAGQSWMPLSSR
jgi:2-oxoglutarate ferredoxin oxidoreductase subunit alpha